MVNQAFMYVLEIYNMARNAALRFVLYFRRGDFDIDDDGRQRRFEELCWVIDGVCIQDNQLKWLGQLKDPLYFTLDFSCGWQGVAWATFNRAASLKAEEASILSRCSSFFSKEKIKDIFFHLSPRLERVLDLSIMGFLFSTERFANERSAVTRVIVILQKKCLITSHPQLFHFKGGDELVLALATKNKSSSSCVLSSMKRETQSPTSSSSDTALLRTELHLHRAVPTCHRIGALGSQTKLSASCLLPRRQKWGRKVREVMRKKVLWNVHSSVLT